MKISVLKPAFVQSIPDKLDDGVLYVSIEYATAVHKCCCGCGSEVVTPLGPTAWKLIYDRKVSLHPSVGSWNLPCRSHYWIQQNTARWAERWSNDRIAAARAFEREAAATYYGGEKPAIPSAPVGVPTEARESLWARLRNWFAG
jgi:hypothetical protein